MADFDDESEYYHTRALALAEGSQRGRRILIEDGSGLNRLKHFRLLEALQSRDVGVLLEQVHGVDIVAQPMALNDMSAFIRERQEEMVDVPLIVAHDYMRHYPENTTEYSKPLVRAGRDYQSPMNAAGRKKLRLQRKRARQCRKKSRK